MIKLIQGDCLEVMATLAENSVDTIITDPPYGLKFMGKDWDHGVPGIPFWQAALRVAKPGATMLCFGGDRTHHRLMVAIEDEIKEALLIGLRAAVNRIEIIGEKGVADLDVKTAMSAIPRLAKELQDIYGVGKKAGATKHVEEILSLLPLGIQQKVMIIIDQRQQAQLPANTRGEIIDGEVRELEPARVVSARKGKNKQI